MFLERSRFDQHRDPLRRSQTEVITAAVTDTEGGGKARRFEGGITLWTGEPVDLLTDAGSRRR
jgi:hypothetical protein